MKSASTAQRTEDLISGYNAKRSKPIAKIEYFDSQWKPLEDVKSFSFGRSSSSKDVARFSLVPNPQTLNISIDNRGGKYSPDTSGKLSNILRRNLPLRGAIGYAIDSTENPEITYTHDINSYSELYKTIIVGNKIYNSEVGPSVFGEMNGNVFTKYGDLKYDEGTYSGEAYYKSNIIDFGIYDVEILKRFIITSDTNKIKVYYRAAISEDILRDGATPFIYLADTIVGTASMGFPTGIESYRYFQFAIVFCTGEYRSDINYASDMSIIYTSSAEYFPLGEFLVDSADFGSEFSSKGVSVSARDKLKKAIKSNASTPAFISEDVGYIIRYVCDKMSLPHNDGVTEYIADTGDIVSIDGFKDKKGIDILQEAILYLSSKDQNYRLYVNDNGYIELSNKSDSSLNYDFIFNYLDHVFSFSRRFTSDNILQRITVFSSEENNKTGSENILGSAVFTTAGVQSITWSGINLKKTYRFVINSGNFRYIEMGNTSFTFEIIGASPNISVTVYGDPLDSSYSGFCGEAANGYLIESGEGYKKNVICHFIQSDAEAQAIAEAMISRFSDDIIAIEGSIAIDGMPLIEINDLILVLENYTNTFQLFVVEGISTEYDAAGARYKNTLQIRSSGNSLQSIVYDRNYAMSGNFGGVDDLLYDAGLFYDLSFWGEAEDSDVYRKKVIFS